MMIFLLHYAQNSAGQNEIEGSCMCGKKKGGEGKFPGKTPPGNQEITEKNMGRQSIVHCKFLWRGCVVVNSISLFALV